MSKPNKIILAIATLWPLVYFHIFIGFWLYLTFWASSLPRGGEETRTATIVIFAMHGITILWIFALTAIYIRHVFKNQRVANDRKPLWANVLLFGNVISMPIYWYLYIWRKDQ